MGEHIGFIGLGRMGGHMAGRLIDAGHTLTVFDVNAQAVAAPGDSALWAPLASSAATA